MAIRETRSSLTGILMNNLTFRLLMFSALLMLMITPFAGLAPLMLLLTVGGVIFAWGSIFQVLINPKVTEELTEENGDTL